MKLAILHKVSEDIARQCSAITGLEVVLNDPKDAEIQLAFRNFFPNPSLTMIQTISAGVDHVKFSEIPEEVTICSNAGAFSDPVAEHAFAMLLAHAKKICKFESETRAGIYRKDSVISLSGKTLGILGHGGIGRSSAKIAKAFGMRVLAYTRSPSHDQNVDEFVNSADAIFSSSDVVLIALPLTAKTVNIVNRKLLDQFHGYAIINVARANVVSENDMKSFLSANPDKYYLSDVWWNEPKVVFPLPENAFLTPHVGGISKELEDYAVLRACENIKRYLDGHPENVVNRNEYR